MFRLLYGGSLRNWSSFHTEMFPNWTCPIKAQIARKIYLKNLDFLEEDSSNCKVFIDTWHILSSLILLFFYCTTSFVSVLTSLWRHHGHTLDIRPAKLNDFRISFVPPYNAGCLIHSTFGLFYTLLIPSVAIIFLRDAVQSVPHRVCPPSACFYSSYFQYKVIYQHMVDCKPPARD
jgi:hypothetical protein